MLVCKLVMKMKNKQHNFVTNQTIIFNVNLIAINNIINLMMLIQYILIQIMKLSKMDHL